MSVLPKSSSPFESELAYRTLVSEQRRATILARVLTGFAAVTAIFVSATAILGEYRPGYGWILLLGAVGCVFEWGVSRYLNCAVQRRLQPARFRFYLNAVVELSLPTIMILILAKSTNATFATTGPASYAYYLFIILSALRLDFALCVFTGAAAAVGYAMAGLVNWSALELASGVTPLAIRFSFITRVLLLLLGGVVAGLVSMRLRRTLIETMESLQERERVVALFGQHVSPTVVDQLLTQPRGDTSETRPVCILVLDIRSFTSLSEKRPPGEVVALLNLLWGFMVRAVNEHHGIVNKFLGDGFLAVFGAPLSVGNDCQNAFRAARRILGELDSLIATGTLPHIQVGIALHTGDAIVGNIGSAERKEYTVIGDVVNVAFRLEALNKELGSRLLMSDAVRLAGLINEGLPIAPIQIRGRHEPVSVYRIE